MWFNTCVKEQTARWQQQVKCTEATWASGRWNNLRDLSHISSTSLQPHHCAVLFAVWRLSSVSYKDKQNDEKQAISGRYCICFGSFGIGNNVHERDGWLFQMYIRAFFIVYSQAASKKDLKARETGSGSCYKRGGVSTDCQAVKKQRKTRQASVFRLNVS